jgi:shikimate dehydrogenase
MSESFDILGVAGRPILHSRSPVLFRELFRAAGIEAAYTRVAASSAAEALSLFRSLGLRGMNLTAPFKEEAALLVDELSPEARELGAVNCLLPLGEGRVLGANTDCQGVLGALRCRGIEVAGRRCLVIGAGGAGKAAARALVSAGGEVVVANRTRARADEVAALFRCASGGLDELSSLARAADLIVSTLASEALPDPGRWMPPSAGPAVLDADYKRGKLARYAAERGLAVATGADWLACQALPAYELFMGASAPSGLGPSSLAALLAPDAESELALERKIALVGLMGAGKTQVGKILARLLKLPFVDADREIEAEAGMAIAEIFAREGEAGFRVRERRVLDRITSVPGGSVLATGGGAPTDPGSSRLLKDRCLCVWLHVLPRTAALRTIPPSGRASGDKRPLLAGTDPEARLGALEAERRGAYASCAELLVSTEGREAIEVAEVIHGEIDRIS